MAVKKSMQPDFRCQAKPVKAKLPDVVPHAAPAVPRFEGSREVAVVFHLRYHETWVTDPPMMLVQTMKP